MSALYGSSSPPSTVSFYISPREKISTQITMHAAILHRVRQDVDSYMESVERGTDRYDQRVMDAFNAAIGRSLSSIDSLRTTRKRRKVSVAHGTRFGSWRYDARVNTLDFVPLDGRLHSTVRNPAWWIRVPDAQRALRKKGYVPEKTWLTAEDQADYLRALRELRKRA
jgi:hypothetical protein